MGTFAELVRAVPYLTVRSYAPADRVPFLIVFLSRTGSNLLAAKLDSHPDIVCHHELFNPDGIHRSLSYKDSPLSFGTTESRDRDPHGFVVGVYGFSDGQKAVGFKLAPGQSNAVLLSLLLSRRVRKIVMERRNWLQAYSSELIAQATQVWSVAKNRQAGPSPKQKVRMELAGLRQFIRKRSLFLRLTKLLLKLTGQRFETVDYEDISLPETERRVLDFLGVASDQPLKERTVKQNPSRLRDRIANYDELEQALAGTELGRFLDPAPEPAAASPKESG
ncbi:MAG: hypothetical protein R2909_08715 [Gemmatimonadales bacterium]